jgi:hypothetical protein
VTYPDYSIDWAYHPGVYSGTLTDPDGVATAVHVRRDVISWRDLNGPVVGISPGDTPWILWGLGTQVPANSTLVVGAETYAITASELRGDLNQQRVFGRKFEV